MTTSTLDSRKLSYTWFSFNHRNFTKGRCLKGHLVQLLNLIRELEPREGKDSPKVTQRVNCRQ